MKETRPLFLTLVVSLLGSSLGCAVVDPVGADPGEHAPDLVGADSGDPGLPEVLCTGTPDDLSVGYWNHITSNVTTLGSPRHRGIDLIASSSAATQVVRGEISYGVSDNALEDEWVEVYACRRGEWTWMGMALTDDEGFFELSLTGSERLPIGVRSMYVSVLGDQTGNDFMAFVAPEGTQVVFSDIDGTLTSSENAYPYSLVTGAVVAANEGAPEAIASLRARNFYPIYMTARGRTFTGDTREWLRANGFPTGVLRLAPSLVTLPGSATVAYKSGTIEAIAAEGFVPTVGIGNRASDAEAYGSQGIESDHIFILATEYASEDQPVADRGEAITFESYVDLLPTISSVR